MKAFMFYVEDWISSKRIAQMDAAEERGYLRLLLYAATDPDCGIPDDDAQLAIISMLGSRWFKQSRTKKYKIGFKTSGDKLRECFDICEDGKLKNERMLIEWNRWQLLSSKRSTAGKLGGRPKSNSFSEQKQMESKWKANHKANTKAKITQLVESCSVVSDSDSERFSKSSERELHSKLVEASPQSVPAASPQPPPPPSFVPTVQNAPSPTIHNEDWFDFRQTAESCGMSGSEVDWNEAFMFAYRIMGFNQRFQAKAGLLTRKGTDDPAIRALPVNYLRKRMWERAVRQPQTRAEDKPYVNPTPMWVSPYRKNGVAS